VKRKLITILVGLGIVTIGLSGCYWNAGNVGTASPTMTYTPIISPTLFGTMNPLTTETQLYVTPYPSGIITSPAATTVTTTKASVVTLTKAITNMSKIDSAVVVRNDEYALVGVKFDRDRYNGDLTEALMQEIMEALQAKDSSLKNITVTDNVTYYYKIEDLSKQTDLTEYELQNKMNEIIDAINK